MEAILQWGLDFIRAVQSIKSPPLTFVMRFITFFGGEPVYMALLPLLYWCIDEKKGLRLGMVVLISTWANITLKLLFDQPRPFFEAYDPSLGIITEKMGGLPSGHAQNTLVLLIIIASWIKKKWAYICAPLLCLLIGFSRVYLGVHFPTDVFAGWILGGIILCGYFLFSKKIETLLVKGGIRAGIIASALVSFIMILYLPGKEILMPAGFLLGLGAGYCLNRRYVGFSAGKTLGRTGMAKILILFVRFLLGITGFLLVYVALGKIFPREGGNVNLFSFMRYALVGLWVSVAAPWIFVKLRLGEIESKEQ
jgi:membrane-associated phospholipid phosphatase